ncbi:MAG: hypothetical protein LKCHEGNO_01532 [Burkholderiaceae bacterium]|nr:hypothetical protein [Burkholderiaceae bacterium]
MRTDFASPSNPQPVEMGCLHYVEGDQLFASVGAAVLSGGPNEPLRVIARLPLPIPAHARAAVRLLARFSRSQVTHVVPFADRLIVIGFGQIWCLDRTSGGLLAPPVSLVGKRPLALCATPLALYYGEYRDNRERGPIHLMFSKDGIGWQSIREFSGIRHIHGVYHDSFTDALWLTTGDDDAESAIWCSHDGFRTIERVLGGSQQTRAIGLIFTERHVYFGSDSPLEVNHLYRIDRKNGKTERLMAVEGSVFHVGRAGPWLLFSSAVEPSRINRSHEATIYGSVDGTEWRVLSRHRKDMWHMGYFQYGQLVLPGGDNRTGRLWYSTLAVDLDNRIYSRTLP